MAIEFPVYTIKKEKEKVRDFINNVDKSKLSPFQFVREGSINVKYQSQLNLPVSIIRRVLFEKFALLDKKIKKGQRQVYIKKRVTALQIKRQRDRAMSSAHECFFCKQIYYIKFSLSKPLSKSQQLDCCSFACLRAAFKDALFRQASGESLVNTPYEKYLDMGCKRTCHNLDCQREYWVIRSTIDSKYCSNSCATGVKSNDYKERHEE